MAFPRLCLVALTLLAACTAAADNPNPTNLCKAAIATVMGRDPAIMTARQSDGVVQVRYVRQDDGKPFTYKCKVEGSRLIWGQIDGRWRTHPADGQMNYISKNGTIHIVERYSDGSALEKTYSFQQLQ